MNIEQYVQQDGLALSAQLRAGATDPQALMQCAITLARQRAELLNALCYPDYDAALARAAAWRPTGVFGGLPFLLKDSGLACDRLPSSIGLALCKDMRFAGNAMLVERFDAAGLLPFARTTVPALCMAPTTEALVNGGPPATPGRRSVRPAAPAAAPPSRSPPAWCPWPTAATAAGRSAFRRRAAASSA